MSLFAELKRRNVVRVGVAYLISAWIIAQVVDLVLDGIKAPDWVMQTILLLMGLGFIVALIISWAYEITAEGIKKEADVVRDDSITHVTAKKLDMITLLGVIIVIAMFLWQQVMPQTNNNHNNGDISESNTTTSKNTNKPAAIGSDSDGGKQTQQSQVQKNLTAKLGAHSVAVLPFTNMSADNKNSEFALGIHDDLLTHLSKISALKVISRTSVLRYKNTQKPIAEIAKELGVKNILEGSVQSSGQQIRINVQLIDANTDEHLWAEIYDRKLSAENVFNIQTEISTKIAAALKAQLSPEEQTSLAKQATDNLDAYNAYLAGRQRMLNRTSKGLKQALEFFEKATELDPNYALAYVGQADTLSLLNQYSTLSEEDMFERGEPLIEKALQIDPLLAEAHTSKANYLMKMSQYKSAEQSFKYSSTLNPNYATTYHWYGLMLRNIGRNQEALALHQKAARLDPMSPIIQSNVAWSLQGLRENHQALEQFKRVLQFAPNFPAAAWGISTLQLSMGQFDQTVLWIKKAIALDTGNIGYRYLLGATYLDLDEVKAATAILDQMQQQSLNHDATENMQFNIYLYQENLKKWFQSIEQWYQREPNLSIRQQTYADALVLNGMYKKALPLWLSLYAENDTGVIGINAQNINNMISLVWTYKQLGQNQPANQLLKQMKQAQTSLNGPDMDWRRVLFEAVQGHHRLAAVAYANMIDKGGYQHWWYNEKYPFLTEVKKQPEYIKAHQRLMAILKAQRENLIKLESAGQTE